MNTVSDTLTELHAITRTLQQLRAVVNDKMMTPESAGGAAPRDRAQLEGLHHRISKALAVLSAEERQM